MSEVVPAYSAAALQVGEWHVDPHANTLVRDGQAAQRLEPKAIEVLMYLAHRCGEVAGRDELMAAVWPGVVVGDDTLTQAIIKLRKALGDDARHPRYIETISKRGYRLIVPATPAPVAAPARQRGLWLRGSAIATLALLLSMASVLRHDGGERSNPDKLPVVAVLPFANQSGDAQRDYLSDGLTEDLVNALGLYSGLRVISERSVQTYKAHPLDAVTIGRDLGARYVVQGSLRGNEDQWRVTAELSDAESGVVLWSEHQEGGSGQWFAVQDHIVDNVVGALAVKVTRLEEERALAKAPANLQAYDLVLRARALVLTSTRAANRQARETLTRALQLAPDDAEAHVVFAMAENQRGGDFGWTERPDEAMQSAELHARRALAVGDAGTQARAHAALGIVLSAEKQYDAALAEVERALQINPSDASAIETRGIVLLWLGRADEAAIWMEAGARIDPRGRGAGGDFARALAYYTLRRYPESLALFDTALARYPQTSFLHAGRAAALAQMGDLEAAHSAAAETLRLEPYFHVNEFGSRFVDPKSMAHLQEGLRKAGL